MRFLIPAFCLLASAAHGAWVIEDLPTGIQYNGASPYLITTELSSAYQPVYSGSVKTGENIAVAYRSRYLYVGLRSGSGWNGFRFDDNGRYPSIALDSLGRPHMSYFRSSNNKLYYAHMVSAGTGNCGPNVSWACEEVPTTIYGAPIGRSAITVRGNEVQMLIETASGNASYPGKISRLKKTIGAPDWGNVDLITLSKDLIDMDIKVDSSGAAQFLINSEYMDWYRKPGSTLEAIGPLVGSGAFDITSSGAPRICYRDFTANQLRYGSSNGTDYWTETVIDYNIGPLGSCSIAIPPPATGLIPVGYYSPRIAYYDDASDSLKYATAPLLAAQPWNVQTVATPTGTRKIDLYLDKQGRPTILYFDSSVLKLRLAKVQ